MAAVKCDLVSFNSKTDEIENSDKGRIEFFADLSANASPFFEGYFLKKLIFL